MLEHLQRTRLRFAAAHPVEPGKEHEILEPADAQVERAVPRGDETDQVVQLGRIPPNVTTKQLDRALGGFDEAEQDSDQRRLARAVRPEQRVKLSRTDLETYVVECDLLTEPARQILARDDGSARRAPRSRRAFLRGTGPARAGGARCIVEADTTREPHHLGCARSLVAAPVERDDPPTAVAAAFLVPRRRRRGPASATERVHSGTALRATVPTSIPRPSRSSAASTVSATIGPPAPLIDFSRTSSPPLRPARSARSAETQRTTLC